jgi:hypothetical protein
MCKLISLEAKIMFLSAGFWPLFWAIIGGGAALTGLLSLLVATVRLPRHHHRPALPETATAPRQYELHRRHLMAAGHE